MTQASICTIGDEILIGQIVDTNSSHISRALNSLGIKVTRMLSIGDDQNEIISSLTKELQDNEIVITTGGLGPTKDDITKAALGKLSFSQQNKTDEKQLEILNKITHKFVKNHIKRLIYQNSDRIIVLDVPLLFAPDFDVKCDVTLAVIADMDKRFERVKKRSNMTEEEFYSRVKNQPSDAVLKEKTTYCIVNNDLDEMKKQVREIFDKIKETD